LPSTLQTVIAKLAVAQSLFFSVIVPLQAQTIESREDLNSLFADFGTTGTFVVLDVAGNRRIEINGERAAKRMIPASTFKITNSLIALETGAITSIDEIIPYGGKPQRFKSWERDMSIRDGIKVSNVPVFQEIARRIGLNAYKTWLSKLGYGNGLTGSSIETFWLEGPLKISAIEQVNYLSALAQTQLPVSIKIQKDIAQITLLERRGMRLLHGKTGLTNAPDPDIGWFVGWVQNERGLFPFALNMDITSREQVRNRKRLAKMFLRALDIY